MTTVSGNQPSYPSYFRVGGSQENTENQLTSPFEKILQKQMERAGITKPASPPSEASKPTETKNDNNHDHDHAEETESSKFHGGGSSVDGNNTVPEHLSLEEIANLQLDEAIQYLENSDMLYFERDKVDGKEDDKSTPVRDAIIELMEKDPEFKENFLEAIDNGMHINIRYNADSNQADIINRDVYQIDIPAGDDIEEALSEAFSDNSIKPKEAGKGDPIEKVLTNAREMKGEDFVKEMERLGTFSFSGPNGDKIRKDVIYMFDNSNFMKEMMVRTLEEEPERKFNFSSIGKGGGTIATPFNDFSNSVNTGDAYDDTETKDYKSEDNLGNVGLMAHEMTHSFLGLGDIPMMDIAGAVFNSEIRSKGKSHEGTAPGKIAYDDSVKGKHVHLTKEFDYDAFFEKVFTDPESSNNYSFEDAQEEFGGIEAKDKDED